MSVRVGSNHTCGVDDVGQFWCWGSNIAGQLGDGTTTEATSPVAVVGASALVDVALGSLFTCGIDAAGTAYCWGWNRDGRLGLGFRPLALSPVQVLSF